MELPISGQILQQFDFESEGRRTRTWFVQSEEMPPRHLVTAALGFIVAGESLLLARIAGRDWDLPGGHLEPGESPEQAMRREVMEEAAAVVGRAQIFAHQYIHADDPAPEGFPYPHPDAYMVFFLGELERLEPFASTAESTERRLWSPEEAHRAAWVQRHRPVYDAVLRALRASWL